MALQAVNFDQNPDDTRQYQTHAAWCRYLASRGVLSPDHRSCTSRIVCVSYQAKEILRGR
jgi:hypothetical protein